MQVREIGLKFPGSDDFVADFGIGAIMDSFQSSGILPTRALQQLIDMAMKRRRSDSQLPAKKRQCSDVIHE